MKKRLDKCQLGFRHDSHFVVTVRTVEEMIREKIREKIRENIRENIREEVRENNGEESGQKLKVSCAFIMMVTP